MAEANILIRNMKSVSLIFIICLISLCANAQIGYQVALLNTATGEARANETVSVSLTISNSAGTAIYSGSQTATTNEFGILSLSVGDATTFDGVDWSKLPFYISATVDGTLIGKTQILSVPVAEYAKRTGALTKEILCSKTWRSDNYTIRFNMDGSGEYWEDNDMYQIVSYAIFGDNVVVTYKFENRHGNYYYVYRNSILFYDTNQNRMYGDGTGFLN